jgi:hypothetical protein
VSVLCLIGALPRARIFLIGVLRLHFESAGVESAPFNLWEYLGTGIICMCIVHSRARTRGSKIEQWPRRRWFKGMHRATDSKGIEHNLSPMLFSSFSAEPPECFMYSVTHRGLKTLKSLWKRALADDEKEERGLLCAASVMDSQFPPVTNLLTKQCVRCRAQRFCECDHDCRLRGQLRLILQTNI